MNPWFIFNMTIAICETMIIVTASVELIRYAKENLKIVVTHE